MFLPFSETDNGAYIDRYWGVGWERRGNGGCGGGTICWVSLVCVGSGGVFSV